MNFNVHTAREYAEKNKIDEWVHLYLAAGEWANPGLSNGLKLKKRWWVGPLEIPLEQLVRKCGPEPEMEYLMPPESWERRTNHIAMTVTDPLLLPPAIAEYRDGKLVLADGNHRHEGVRRKGWSSLWAWIWFNSEEDFNVFVRK